MYSNCFFGSSLYYSHCTKNWMSPTAGRFVIDAPPLLVRSTSKVSSHTPNICFLAVCYRHLFCFVLWKPGWCKKVIRGPVLIFYMYIHVHSPLLYTYYSKACFTVQFCLVQNVLQVMFIVFSLQVIYTGLVFVSFAWIHLIVMYTVLIVWCLLGERMDDMTALKLILLA